MGHRQARLPLDETFPTVAIADVRPRVLLQTDGGFTCMRANSVREVRADRTGELFVRCGCGRHYLDGQAENGRYVGLALHPRQPRALAA